MEKKIEICIFCLLFISERISWRSQLTPRCDGVKRLRVESVLLVFTIYVRHDDTDETNAARQFHELASSWARSPNEKFEFLIYSKRWPGFWIVFTISVSLFSFQFYDFIRLSVRCWWKRRRRKNSRHSFNRQLNRQSTDINKYYSLSPSPRRCWFYCTATQIMF